MGVVVGKLGMWWWGSWGCGDGDEGDTGTVTISSPCIQVPQEVAQGWCKEKDIPYFEVSAKNDINVVQAFEMLAGRALSRVSGTCQGQGDSGTPGVLL